MSLAVQGSLFDHSERRSLGAGAWIDVRAGWLNGWLDDDKTLFDELSAAVPWRAERRQMYDREVDVPRMLFHRRLRHYLLLPSCLALAGGLAAVAVNFHGV